MCQRGRALAREAPDPPLEGGIEASDTHHLAENGDLGKGPWPAALTPPPARALLNMTSPQSPAALVTDVSDHRTNLEDSRAGSKILTHLF